MESRKEKGKAAELVRWAWELWPEMELLNCVFLCVVGLVMVPRDVDFGNGHGLLLLELWCLWPAVVLAYGSCFSFARYMVWV